MDIFVALPSGRGGLLVSLSPIYEYLKARGCIEKEEHIVVGDWPVQFLPPSDALEAQAIAEAVAATVEGVGTRVMSAEHLVALALRTGRPKDHARIVQFVEQKQWTGTNCGTFSNAMDSFPSGRSSRRIFWEARMTEQEMRGKKEMRKRLAALSFTEKIKILEQLRDRSLAIAAAGLRRKARRDSSGGQ